MINTPFYFIFKLCEPVVAKLLAISSQFVYPKTMRPQTIGTLPVTLHLPRPKTSKVSATSLPLLCLALCLYHRLLATRRGYSLGYLVEKRAFF